jgi:hypothetical protein
MDVFLGGGLSNPSIFCPNRNFDMTPKSCRSVAYPTVSRTCLFADPQEDRVECSTGHSHSFAVFSTLNWELFNGLQIVSAYRLSLIPSLFELTRQSKHRQVNQYDITVHAGAYLTIDNHKSIEERNLNQY